MRLTLSRVTRGWAIAGAVCLLAPLCLRPAHASAPTLGLGWKRATVARWLPIVSPLRTVHVGQHPALVAIDARDHRVFVANEGPLTGDNVLPSQPGSVSMVDDRTGVVLRTVTVGQSPVAIAFDAPTRRVFVLSAGKISTVAGPASSGSSIAVLDAATGALRRTVEVDPVLLTLSGAGAVPGARQALVVDSASGRVYVVVATGVLTLDGSTGRVQRRIALGGQPSAASLDAAAGRLYVGDAYDPTIPTDPSPTGGTSHGFLAVVDLATGRVRANIVLGQQVVGAIAIDGHAGRVFVIEPNGASERVIIDVLDARTGARLRTTTLTDTVGGGDCAVALDQATGHAFVVYTPDGYWVNNGLGAVLYVLDTTSGMVRQTVPLTSGSGGYFLSRVVAIVRRPARVLVATTRGALSMSPGSVAVYSSNISVFDASGGRFLSTFSVGRGPHDVAIDENTHRIFITNEHDNTLGVFDALGL